MRALSIPVNDLQKKQILMYKSDIFNLTKSDILGVGGGPRHISEKPDIIVKLSKEATPKSILIIF